MKTSGSLSVRHIIASLAMLALACGGRSTLDSLPGETEASSGGHSGVSTQGGALHNGGQTFATGGISGVQNSTRSTAPTGGTRNTWTTKTATGGTRHFGGSSSAGGSRVNFGGTTYFGGSWNAGGTTRSSTSAAGGSVHFGGSWSVGGTTRSSTSSVGGTVPFGGSWSAGGTTRTFTISAGTTSIITSLGGAATGGWSPTGGWNPTGGSTPLSGGSSTTGGATAAPWTSVCNIGLTECGADAAVTCVDTKTDVNNCGFCGHACQAGWGCYSGQCRAPQCTGRFTLGPDVFDMRYTSNSSINSMIAADLNADGLLDIAASDYVTNSVSVRLREQGGGFRATASYPTGFTPVSLASGDFNQDGKLDIVTVNASNLAGVSVLLGNGDGTFGISRDLASVNVIDRVSVGDVNGDTFPDLVTDSAGSNVLQVFLGSGAGDFARPVTYAFGFYIGAFAVADLNGDSRGDVLFLDPNGASVGVMPGSDQPGTPLSPAIEYPIGADYPQSFAVGDVNNDRSLDIVVACSSPNVVAVMLGNGKGGLSALLPYAATTSAATALGDLNGDSNLDIVLVGPNSMGYGGNVGIRLGLGTGAFAKEAVYPFTPGAVSPVVSDFDDDGKLDIAALDSYNGSLSVLSGNGDGSLSDRGRFPVPNCPSSLTLTDVSRDGAADLIVSNGYSPLDVYLGPIRGLQQPNDSSSVAASQVVHGDLDRDGLEDLVAYSGYNSLSVLFGTGGGKFTDPLMIGSSSIRSVALADIDADGWQDVVSFNYGSYTLDVNRNLGNRQFADYQTLLYSEYVYDLAAADLNDDTVPELIMVTPRGLNVALAIGPAAYADPVLSSAESAEWLELADFDSDGNIDVATASSWWLSVHMGLGNGSFATGNGYSTQYISGLAVDDVNGDGHTDMITLGYTIGMLLGKGDGTFTVEQVSSYASSSGGLAIGDMNGDGWSDVVFSFAYSSPCEVNVLYGRCR